jgi:hypothetical protein
LYCDQEEPGLLPDPESDPDASSNSDSMDELDELDTDSGGGEYSQSKSDNDVFLEMEDMYN